MHRYILALGLVIGTTMPTLAQQDNAAGHEKQIIDEIARKFEAGYNHKDAAAVAALYTKNTVEVAPSGIVQGRDAVQKRTEDEFKSGGHDLSINVQIAYSAGDTILSAGEWSAHFGEQPAHGYGQQ